eukprot:SAG22_NODE_742_length_7506_cov_16.663561_4_plen_48_part_00
MDAPPFGLVSEMQKFSCSSGVSSRMMGTLMSFVVSPSAKVSVPLVVT